MGGLLGYYAQYLQQKKDTDYGDMGLQQLPLYVNDEEFQRFISEFGAFMRPWLKLQPDPERQQRLFNIILMTMHPSDENDGE